MLFKASLILLGGWLLGVFDVYSVGRLHHVLFLVGFMLMLLSFARARDEAMREARRRDADTASTLAGKVGSRMKRGS